MILDWEDALPSKELELSELNFKKAELCLCLGKKNKKSKLNYLYYKI